MLACHQGCDGCAAEGPARGGLRALSTEVIPTTTAEQPIHVCDGGIPVLPEPAEAFLLTATDALMKEGRTRKLVSRGGGAFTGRV